MPPLQNSVVLVLYVLIGTPVNDAKSLRTDDEQEVCSIS